MVPHSHAAGARALAPIIHAGRFRAWKLGTESVIYERARAARPLDDDDDDDKLARQVCYLGAARVSIAKSLSSARPHRCRAFDNYSRLAGVANEGRAVAAPRPKPRPREKCPSFIRAGCPPVGASPRPDGKSTRASHPRRLFNSARARAELGIRVHDVGPMSVPTSGRARQRTRRRTRAEFDCRF